MAVVEVWDAAVLMAPAWGLESGAAWLWAMPLQLRSGWLLLSQSQWVSALVCRLRSPRLKYRPGPNHTRYLVDQHCRTESKRCGQPRY
jgi:hypothetical protein